jgi:hypothetical protein
MHSRMGTIVVAAFISLSAGVAAADDCATPYDAMVAQAKQPHVVSATIVRAGLPSIVNEIIITGGRLYMKSRGSWTSMPQPLAATLARLDEAKKNGAGNCHQSADETLDGQAVAVYAVHLVNKDRVSDNRLWISKHSGLPLRTEARLQSGTTVLETFRYDNVQAPPGVK